MDDEAIPFILGMIIGVILIVFFGSLYFNSRQEIKYIVIESNQLIMKKND